MCSVYIVLHKGKPFLKHLELKTCGWPNGRHSENFHCRVWARIKILVSSYKSYDHMSPLEGRVLHIDYMFIHLSCMYHKEKEVPRPSFATPDWTKMMGNEERGQREAHCQKEVESIRGEVAKIRSAWISVEHQRERECLHSLLWEHCLSMSHWSYTFSFQSWIIAAMPSVIS